MQETNYYSEENQFAIQALKCFDMVKRIFDLCFTKNNQFVIYKRYSIFGIFISKKEIASFSDIEEAVTYLKNLI
jgi:hypothetical protein